MTTPAGSHPTTARVLEFYRTLPFNVTGTPRAMAEAVAAKNTLSLYPPLARVCTPDKRVLDLGCGAGWLANTIAYHQKSQVIGVDMNPVAVEFASNAAGVLNLGARFEVADLFEYSAPSPFDVVASVGVLHHTYDCHGALRRAAALVRPKGFLFVGLYHLHGRAPFLEHFARMSAAGADEDAMLGAFGGLFGDQAIDRTHLVSWFRDQVLHPHETQHTLAEVAPVLECEGMRLLATSLNDYGALPDRSAWPDLELGLRKTAEERLARGEYYPGFFCAFFRKDG